MEGTPGRSLSIRTTRRWACSGAEISCVVRGKVTTSRCGRWFGFRNRWALSGRRSGHEVFADLLKRWFPELPGNHRDFVCRSSVIIEPLSEDQAWRSRASAAGAVQAGLSSVRIRVGCPRASLSVPKNSQAGLKGLAEGGILPVSPFRYRFGFSRGLVARCAGRAVGTGCGVRG